MMAATTEPQLTLAIACTGADYDLYRDYWSEIGQRLDHRIRVLVAVQSETLPAEPHAIAQTATIDVDFSQRFGLSRSRNRCMDLCRTKWLWLMDADSKLSEDFLQPDSLDALFNALEDRQAIFFNERASGTNWQSAPRLLIAGASVRKLTSLRSPNMIFDVDFAKANGLRFSEFLGKNSRLTWPRHGEEFAFALGLALQGATIERIEYSPVNALRPSTGASLGRVEQLAALPVIAATVAIDWLRSRLLR